MKKKETKECIYCYGTGRVKAKGCKWVDYKCKACNGTGVKLL